MGSLGAGVETIMLESNKEAILQVIRSESRKSDQGVYWGYIRNGQYGFPPLHIPDEQAAEAINTLIKEEKVKIQICEYDLRLQLTQ